MLTGPELGKAIEQARLKKGVSKAVIAREFGVKQPSIQGWVKTGRISKDVLDDLIDYFSDVVGPEHWGTKAHKPRPPEGASRTIEIERYDVAGSMGKGITAPDGYVDVVERLSVNLDYLRRFVSFSQPSNLAVITGFGDSMKGTYNDGDLLLLDRGVTEIGFEGVYAVRYKGEIFIKRMQRRPDKPLLMLSDNKKYPPVEIKPSKANSLEVLGRILLAWNANKL